MKESQELDMGTQYPALNSDEKLAIRDIQHALLLIREKAIADTRAAEQTLSNTVAELAIKYGVNTETTDFNLNSLGFVAKP